MLSIQQCQKIGKIPCQDLTLYNKICNTVKYKLEIYIACYVAFFGLANKSIIAPICIDLMLYDFMYCTLYAINNRYTYYENLEYEK